MSVDQSLPPALAERLRWLVSPADAQHQPGEFVLYWMHSAMRGHENPALDVAICLARQNGLPLLVYHALSEDYPYSSDRFHAFILQGQRDVQRELADRGIESHFHLARDGDRGPHLRDLTRRAAVLVTEDMPVHPLVGWMERLVARTSTPIAMVDASCIVPMQLSSKSYQRAFEYRDATKELYEERIDREYSEQQIDCEFFQGPMPFKSLDLQDVCLASLIAGCRIDHSIAPVADTPGGTRAGYKRWNQFRTNGLNGYEEERNDASNRHGVSRMSAYLHFGMVSPFRIARQADAAGAQKYLDELLIWRELSFNFCFHNLDALHSIEALPAWAIETLDEHASDQREDIYRWEVLSRGKTGQPLWDACQRSLVKHGELHNNVRMTWGKAFLRWAPSPAAAIQLTMDLNHRYALDGRDPCSYGGVLWCFGLFDRPFQPARDVFGNVRERCCETHESRLDLEKFRASVDRPIAARTPKVAVVGAGVGGLVAARCLQDHGLDVTVFDKSRGVGGRLATRREDGLAFDHGAQYFTARDSRFTRYVRSWMQQGLVEPWMGRIVKLDSNGACEDQYGTPRYVAVPGMNNLAEHLAEELNIKTNTAISRIDPAEGKWKITDAAGNDAGTFDWVTLNCPPKQSLKILDGQSVLSKQIAEVKMDPCWAMMLTTADLGDIDFDGAFVENGPLSWIAHDGSKPRRLEADSVTNWTLHASAAWSEAHLECCPSQIQSELLQALEQAVKRKVRPLHCKVHRWRYALPKVALDDQCLWDPVAGLGACGDWCFSPRIEGAFLSGMAMAGTMLRQLTIDRPPAGGMPTVATATLTEPSASARQQQGEAS
jgi:photolyase PhrII